MLQHAWNERSVIRFLLRKFLSCLAGSRHIRHSQGYSVLALQNWFQFIPKSHPLFDGHRFGLVPAQSDRNFNPCLRRWLFRRWLACSLAADCRHPLGWRIFLQSCFDPCFCSFLATGFALLVTKTESGKRTLSRCHRFSFRARLGIFASNADRCRSLISSLVSCCVRHIRYRTIRWLSCHRTAPRKLLASFPSNPFCLSEVL